MESNKSSGKVKWFDKAKGYGFIQPDNGGKDVFVHISALSDSGIQILNENQSVSYDLSADPKNGKVSATNIDLI